MEVERMAWIESGAVTAVALFSSMQFLWLRPAPGMPGQQAGDRLALDVSSRGAFLKGVVHWMRKLRGVNWAAWDEILDDLRDMIVCMPVHLPEQIEVLRPLLWGLVPYTSAVVPVQGVVWSSDYEWFRDARVVHAVQWVSVWALCGSPLPSWEEWESAGWFDRGMSEQGMEQWLARCLAMHLMSKVRLGDFWAMGVRGPETVCMVRERVLELVELPIYSRQKQMGPREGTWLDVWWGSAGAGEAAVMQAHGVNRWMHVLTAGDRELQGVRSWYGAPSWDAEGQVVRFSPVPGRWVPPECWRLDLA